MSPIDHALSGSGRITRSCNARDVSKEKKIIANKKIRCNKCKNCLKLNCKNCVACKDMKKHGGQNKLKKACFKRKQCLALTPHERKEKEERLEVLIKSIKDKIPEGEKKRKPGRPRGSKNKKPSKNGYSKKSKNQTEAVGNQHHIHTADGNQDHLQNPGELQIQPGGPGGNENEQEQGVNSGPAEPNLEIEREAEDRLDGLEIEREMNRVKKLEEEAQRWRDWGKKNEWPGREEEMEQEVAVLGQRERDGEDEMQMERQMELEDEELDRKIDEYQNSLEQYGMQGLEQEIDLRGWSHEDMEDENQVVGGKSYYCNATTGVPQGKEVLSQKKNQESGGASKDDGDKAREDLQVEKRLGEDHVLTCDWSEHIAQDGTFVGNKYYYNSKTRESVWEKPQELKDYEARVAEFQQNPQHQVHIEQQGHSGMPRNDGVPPNLTIQSQLIETHPSGIQQDLSHPSQGRSGRPLSAQDPHAPPTHRQLGPSLPPLGQQNIQIEMNVKINMSTEQFIAVGQAFPAFPGLLSHATVTRN